MKMKLLKFYLIVLLTGTISLVPAEGKQEWEHIARRNISNAHENGVPQSVIDGIQSFVAEAIKNKRFDDSTKFYGDPTIPDSVWVDAYSSESSAKEEFSEKVKYNRKGGISDTENIRIGYPFKVFYSSSEIRLNTKINTYNDIICPTMAAWLFPLWYKNVSVGYRVISTGNECGFNDGASYGIVYDHFSELRQSWPLEKGYNPVLVIISNKSGLFDYYFHIPQKDSTNFTALRLLNKNLTNEDAERITAINTYCNGRSATMPILKHSGRYNKLTAISTEISKFR